MMLIILFLSPAGAVWGRGYDDSFAWSIQVAYGQHFTGNMIAPTFFPALELRCAYGVSRDFTLRLDLGTGLTKITESDRLSFEGAWFMVGHFSLVFLYTPEVSDSFRLNLGGALGLWFSAMWGEHDLLGNLAGSMTKYLEALSVSYALVAGVQWSISDRWALFLELRGNMAMVQFGQEYNAGGVTVLMGFAYRVRSSVP